ncbi:MAG TPA: glycosyltransferase family 4 protein [Gemmatimonadaceae bacterium]|nr:glycosyltransferase family 4 protein [Gemmatimonadaceae bacterium]
MRIALVSTPFVSVPPADYGGTELVVHELAEGLVDRRHDVVVFATGDSCSRAEVRACFSRAVWPPEHFTDLDHTAWAMHQIARDGGFDIVHAHTAPALAWARFLDPVPLVYTLHHERVRELSRYYAAHPEVHFVAISEDQHQREIPLPRMAVIRHGVEPRLYEWRARAHDYVCFIGRLAPVKGVHVAIDVAGAAGLEIRVAGSVHAEDAAWAARVLAPRLARPYVHQLGRVGMAKKVPLLRDARALLAPIDWEEPFGLVLVEAMLSGCPVVAFARGSVPELVEPGVTGFVAHSAEEMAEIIAPGGPVEHFDRWRCRQRAAARFNSGRMVDEYEELYERILSRRPATEDRGDQRRLHVA